MCIILQIRGHVLGPQLSMVIGLLLYGEWTENRVYVWKEWLADLGVNLVLPTHWALLEEALLTLKTHG